ncbi:MAG: hypothetical protein WHV28_08335 [Bacteroidota bacterium]
MKRLIQVCIIAFLFLSSISSHSQVLYLKDGALFYVNSGANVSVNGGVEISPNATLSHNNSQSSNLWVSGIFRNLGNYNQNGFGVLRFFGSLQDSITGLTNQTFERIWVMKSGTGMVNVSPLLSSLTISNSLRLVSNNIFNIHRSNLIIEVGANIFPDSTSSYTNDPIVDPFNSQKFVMTSGERQLSGKIIRKLPVIPSLASDLNVRFPIGTPLDTANPVVRNYSPVRYVFAAGEMTAGANAYLSVRCIAAEHPNVEVQGVSLRKYWKTDFANIFVQPGGYSLRFNYNDNEIQGVENQYLLTLFYRPYDGPNGTYYINPGAGYGIESVNNRFYIDEVNRKDTLSGSYLLLDGEWTAGQEETISTFYYSRADGDWNDPNTWSKQGFFGAPAGSYPSTINDKVFIGNGRNVSVSSTTPEVKTINVQSSGQLSFPVFNAFVQGDSLFVEDGGKLNISSPEGITQNANAGNVRTRNRSYSQNAIYEYFGNQNQITGDGLPDIVRSLIINKTNPTDTVSLTKSILIKDSLVVNEGTFHLFKNGNFSANGETADTTVRQIIMRGGYLVMQTYPTKYKNAVFTAGTLVFDGSGSFRLPSSGSPSPGEPAVTQYHNIRITGNRAANTYITLDPTGEIRIGGELDISALSFHPTPIADRFIVTGSTVVFNGNGNQHINTGYPTPADLVYRLKFHNLNIAGSGDKIVMPPNDANPSNNFMLVRNNINLISGRLVANDQHIKLLHSWVTQPGGQFDAGNGLVTFEADGKVTSILSNGVVFNNVRIMGTAINGVVNYLDSITINGNLTIDPATFRDLNSTALAIRGNFTNLGTFSAQNGRVYFNGVGNQTLINNGKGTFYNLTVNKTSGNVLLDGDSLIKVTNNLTLIQGNISGRSSTSVPNKPIVVDGTITRPGANPGHIDGRLRLPFGENSVSKLFPIGLGSHYAPMNLSINGWGGAAGYLDAYVLVDTAAPNITRTVIQTQLPNGPELDTTRNVRKVWVLHADTTTQNRFTLSSTRTYDAEFFFTPADTTGRGNPLNFEIFHRDTIINTGRWTRVGLGARNPLSTVMINNSDLDNNSSHYFIIGEPRVFTFYSIANGNWNSPSTWSTASYTSTEPSTRAPESRDNIRIGNGKTVVLNVNHNVDAGRSVTVETGGAGFAGGNLEFADGSVLLTGAGTFRLDSAGALTIRHAQGITASGASGCIRTTTRQYNFNNHNSGHFIYAGTGNQATGNGMPLTMRTFRVNKPSGTLTITGTTPVILYITDSLYLQQGTTNLSNAITKIGGNFVIDSGASFNPGNRRLTYLGDNPHLHNNADTTQWEGVVVFNGPGTQYIKGTYKDQLQPLVFNRISMNKPSGVVISQFNITVPIFWFKIPNRANFNVFNNNKRLVVYDSLGGTYALGRYDVYLTTGNDTTMPNPQYGWVIGRLIRYMNINENPRYFPIGTQTKYAPLIVNRQELGATTGQVAGLIEIIAVDGNHPKFNPISINQNTNIQRYYEITLPVGMNPQYVQGNRALTVRMFFTQDEPRGGINPLNYRVFRLLTNDTWTRSANIQTRLNQTTELTCDANFPSLGGNNIFNVTSQFSSSPAIVLMIGEDPPSVPERIFYSRNSGNWSNPNTWSYATVLYEDTEQGYILTTNSVNDYPRFNNTSYRDYAIIGDGDSVYFDLPNVNVRYVLLEKSANGVGKLVMPGESYIQTDQFVMKNGGKLFIGSASGIVQNSTTTGNIRQNTASSIINFDWNDLGVNNFAYIGTSTNVVQQTGSGLPNTVASLEINYNRSAADRYVDLTNSAPLTIRDSIVFRNGRFRNRDGAREIFIRGDIVNYSGDVGFHNQTNPSNRRVYFIDTLNQRIRGTAALTVFPQTVRLQKPSGGVIAERNIQFSDSVQFRSNTIFALNDNTITTFGATTVIDSLQLFGPTRLFKVSGGPNTARVRKSYPVSTNQTYTFTFPIGEDSLGLRPVRYSEARVTLTNQTYTANNYLEIALRSNYPHPQAPSANPNMFRKYWSINTSNIQLGSGTSSLRFKYNDAERVGNILNYRPLLYRRADIEPKDPGWGFALFNASNLQIDTTNKFIIIDNAQTLPNHDWTAGEPSSFERPRLYWSRQYGIWSNPFSWTNDYNSGNPHSSSVAALNTPGFFEGDTIIIGSNHQITLDRTPRFALDSVYISSSSSIAELFFGQSFNKSLRVKNTLHVGPNGSLKKVMGPPVRSIDTLYIDGTFRNDGTGASGGVRVFSNDSVNLRLVFQGNKHSFIKGEGVYHSIGTIRVFKSDSIYNLHNESQSFSNAFTSAVLSQPSVDFILDAGMYYHDNPANITLSTDGDGDVFLGDLVGLVVRDGSVTYSDGLICGQNASVWLLNGTMNIGNQKDEHFQYESVTIIDFAGNSKLNIAGAMRRRFLTSAVDFRIKDNAEIRVMIKGATTDPSQRRAAFDFGEANSKFSMTGGRVLVLRTMDTSATGEKDPDYFVNTTVNTVTGGTVQIGHPDSLLTNTLNFDVISSVPFWNLDVANTYGKELLLGSPIISVRNDLIIRDSAVFNLNGNTLNLGGDLTIDGRFLTGNIGSRRFAFVGSSLSNPPTKQIQNVKIKRSNNEPFFDLAISKSNGGSVDLSSDPNYQNSNLIIRNTLEFSIGNTAIVNTNNRYVQVGTSTVDLATIQRFSQGHVNGELRRWINNGSQNVLFTVGSSDTYTPAQLDISSGLGTQGLLSVTAYGNTHPDLANCDLHQTNTQIDRYWRIVPAGSPQFDLGSGRTFALTTFFRKGYQPSGDLKVGTSFGIMEHFRRTPAWNAPGSWYTTVPELRTDSSTTSINNTAFGDFFIAEIAGLRFYSRQSGNWNDINTWSTEGYTGAVAPRLPNIETDRVFIGNGRVVTVNQSNPRIRSLTVEKNNGLPGKLVILDERYIRGLSFELRDSCYLATDDAYGFNSVTGVYPNIGAIRTTNIRSYGKGIFEYIGSLNQATGDGPTNPKTVIVNNSGSLYKTVTFSPATYTVDDTIRVELGNLSFGNANVNLLGNLIANNGTKVFGGTSSVSINGNGNQYIIMNDTSGVNFYNLTINKNSGNLILSGSADSTELTIARRLTFTNTNTSIINARTNNKIVRLLHDTTSIVRNGIGHIDGMLSRPFGTGTGSFKFEVGFGNIYTPAELSLSAGSGNSGFISVIANSPPSIDSARVHEIRRVSYWWQIRGKNNFALGTRQLNTKFTFPASEVNNFPGGNVTNAYLLRKSYPVETPLWNFRQYSQLNWNTSLASVEITNTADYWSGLGDFYIGEKKNLAFYSKRSGLWNDHNTWALNESRTVFAPEGEFPGNVSEFAGDSVIIGWNDSLHNVRLNIPNPNVGGVTLLYNGRLDLHNQGTMLANSITGSSAFRLLDSSTVAFGGTVNPTTSVLTGFANYFFGEYSNIEFYGTQTLTPNPFGLSNYPNNVILSGNGTKFVSSPILILGNLLIKDNATLNVNEINALSVRKNVINNATIDNQGVIEIGE